MKLIPVETVPRRWGRHHLQDLIAEFVKSDAKVVRVDFNEHDYKSAISCQSCLRVAAKRSGYPVKVMRREKNVFLSKM